ncbi:MAG: class I SAM-dependent methyltransferase [Ignavibacteriae bacterium]|nr:class I SAM-dependent methyltransferase [Ignavibacteriota bacterium]NOG98354.1 class I SAM-dependent methyltransferase [Ignavibacteriota bacterium]
MFNELKEINKKPKPFEFYTAAELWTNEYTAEQMLQFHLNEDVDAASRNKEFIDRSVEWIIDNFKVNGNTKLADFGCGPGLYTTPLAETGAKVTGIDFNKVAIDHAKKVAQEKNLDIDYIVADYLKFETEEKFDLILLVFTDYCVLSPKQRKVLLNKFRTMLKPNGLLFMDVQSIEAFNKVEEKAIYEKNQLFGFWSPDDYYGFVNTYKYEEEKVSLDKYTIFEENRKRVVYNWFQYFDIESLKNEFEENGLKIVEKFSDVAGKPFNSNSDEIAVAVKKQ